MKIIIGKHFVSAVKRIKHRERFNDTGPSPSVLSLIPISFPSTQRSFFSGTLPEVEAPTVSPAGGDFSMSPRQRPLASPGLFIKRKYHGLKKEKT